MSEGELHLLEVRIQRQGDMRTYGLAFDSSELWPTREAMKAVHRECQETFEHERLADGQLLGYAGLTGDGELVEISLADPEEVEKR